MSSLSAKDRVSLCTFTFSDGRRCRTPRFGKHPHFCFDHAQKEVRARAAQSLSKNLDYFFSGTISPPAISAPPCPASSPPFSAAM